MEKTESGTDREAWQYALGTFLMPTNDLLLAHLAAQSADEPIAQAMAGAVFGLTGEIGQAGFGATTLEGHLVVFTHPEFYRVAGLPEGLDAVEATARQAADYARAVGLLGFVINPGTHQRFVPIGLWQDEVGGPQAARRARPGPPARRRAPGGGRGRRRGVGASRRPGWPRARRWRRSPTPTPPSRRACSPAT